MESSTRFIRREKAEENSREIKMTASSSSTVILQKIPLQGRDERCLGPYRRP